MLKPGLPVVWRDSQTVQVGVDPRRAVALTGLGRAAADVLRILDGSRDRAGVRAAADVQGIPAEAADRVLDLLAAGDALDGMPRPAERALPGPTRARLGPDMAAAALAHRQHDGGAAIIMRRRASHVRVHGAGRIGSSIASLLAASGVGRVSCADPRPASFGDLAPAGLHHADLGIPRERGAARAVRRIAPEARTAGTGCRPDLAVLTAPPDPRLVTGLMRDGIPHLAATATEAIAAVGPLVAPGRSACIRCIDLSRRDRDPAWPLIAAQLAGAEPSPPACDTVLAATAATQAAAQALAFIDGAAPGPAAINGTLELVMPDWRWRRRTWPMHYDCSCSRNDVV
jgi:ThiF family